MAYIVAKIQLVAARRLGKLVAQGILHPDDCTPWLVKAAQLGGYDGDLGGLQTQLSWAMLGSAERWFRQRQRVEPRIRWAIRPLLNARQMPDVVNAAAFAANEADKSPFLTFEVRALLRAEVEQWLAFNARRSRYAR